MNIKYYLTSIICSSACILSSLAFSSTAYADINKTTPTTPSNTVETEVINPEIIELHYTVNIYDSNLGEIHTTITKNKNNVQINSITRAEGLASLVMGGDLKQNCSFETQGNKIHTLTSSVEKLRRNAFKKSISLDWTANKVHFEEDVSLDIPTGYVVDICNFHFAAAYTDINFLKNNTIYSLDAKKQQTKGYVFKSASPETLETKAGVFHTTKIILERELNPDRSFIFWVAKENPYFPIKMMDSRKKNSRTMTLKSIKRESTKNETLKEPATPQETKD